MQRYKPVIIKEGREIVDVREKNSLEIEEIIRKNLSRNGQSMILNMDRNQMSKLKTHLISKNLLGFFTIKNVGTDIWKVTNDLTRYL